MMDEKLLNEELSRSNGPRRWPVNLFECFSYRDIKGNKRWCPEFCPKTMCCGNSAAGRIHTSLIEEEPICCGMGKQGLCCCIMLCPLAVYSPTGGLGAFCVATNYLRQRTIEKYGVEEQDFCNYSNPHLNSCCNYCCYGFHYPCSLFQMVVSIEYWDAEENLPLGDSTYMANVATNN